MEGKSTGAKAGELGSYFIQIRPRRTQPAAQGRGEGWGKAESSQGSKLVALLGGEQLQREHILNEGGSAVTRRDWGLGNGARPLGPELLR